MSTSGKSSFKKLSQRSSPSPSTPSPPPPPPETFPLPFFCPITDRLMADSVVIPTSETFDQIIIKAFRELNFTPLRLSSLSSIDFSSPSLALISNLALKRAILDWCDSAGGEGPSPCCLQTAKGLVEKVMRLGNQKRFASAGDRSDAADVFLKEILKKLKETPMPLKNFLTTQGSSDQESSSVAALAESSEPRTVGSAADNPLPSSSSSRTRSDKNLEKKILRKLKNSQISENESGLANLIRLIKESPEHYRDCLCTERIMAALIAMLQSSNARISVSVMEAIYVFSLFPSNRIKIVQCGAVPHLVTVLGTYGIIEDARAKAAGAIYNLAINEECRMPIGASGVMPRLIERFFDPKKNVACREESGLALCYLVLCSGNQPRFADCRATLEMLLTANNYDEAISREEDEVPTELRQCAVILLYYLVGTNEMTEILMHIGTVGDMLRMVRKGEGIEVYCLALLYNIFLHDPTGFRRLAIEERAEEVFAEMKEAWGEDGRELARRMLEIIRGD